jgi:hypothetical protein
MLTDRSGLYPWGNPYWSGSTSAHMGECAMQEECFPETDFGVDADWLETSSGSGLCSRH